MSYFTLQQLFNDLIKIELTINPSITEQVTSFKKFKAHKQSNTFEDVYMIKVHIRLLEILFLSFDQNNGFCKYKKINKQHKLINF